MDTRLKALFLVSVGVLLLPLGFHLAGNPKAPFSLGGIPQPLYAGVAAGYIVGGGTAYLAAEREQAPPPSTTSFEHRFWRSRSRSSSLSSWGILMGLRCSIIHGLWPCTSGLQ